MSNEYNNIISISKKVKTPFYIYYGDIIVRNVKLLSKAFENYEIFYSIKANPHLEVCSQIAQLGLGAEVVTKEEMQIALSAGFGADNVLFAGPAKTENQIDYAVEKNIQLFTAESINQLVLLNNRAIKYNKVLQILIRINDAKLKSKNNESMVGVESQFGIDYTTLLNATPKIKKLSHLKIVGTQYYQASQILNPKLLAKSVEHQVIISNKISKFLAFDLKILDIGGGFGIPYLKEDRQLDIKKCASLVDKILNKKLEKKLNIIVESGRYLVGTAGRFITKVIDVKVNYTNNYVICDGGFNGFTRPILVNSPHRVTILKPNSGKIAQEWTLCGFSCSSIDSYGKVIMPLPEIGDLIAIEDAGAYGHSMSILQFHSVSKPEEVYIPASTESLH